MANDTEPSAPPRNRIKAIMFYDSDLQKVVKKECINKAETVPDCAESCYILDGARKAAALRLEENATELAKTKSDLDVVKFDLDRAKKMAAYWQRMFEKSHEAVLGIKQIVDELKV